MGVLCVTHLFVVRAWRSYEGCPRGLPGVMSRGRHRVVYSGDRTTHSSVASVHLTLSEI